MPMFENADFVMTLDDDTRGYPGLHKGDLIYCSSTEKPKKQDVAVVMFPDSTMPRLEIISYIEGKFIFYPLSGSGDCRECNDDEFLLLGKAIGFSSTYGFDFDKQREIDKEV